MVSKNDLYTFYKTEKNTTTDGVCFVFFLTIFFVVFFISKVVPHAH